MLFDFSITAEGKIDNAFYWKTAQNPLRSSMVTLYAYFLQFIPYFHGRDADLKNQSKTERTELRITPEDRLCAKFDSTSIALFPVADREEMGMRVLDDCAEEHIM